MRRFLILLFLQCLCAAGLALPDLTKAAQQQNLLLFYSNDVIGETDPCG
jgi:hypothetical protein